MARSSSALGLASAAAFLAIGAYTDAFTVPSQSQRSISAAPSLLTNSNSRHISRPAASFTSLAVLSKEQALYTAERLAGMSRGEIQHIFEDLDADGSGSIDLSELDLLAKYFPGETFTPEIRAKLMKEIDTDGNGEIDAEEFYQWMVVNAKSDGSADSKGTKQMQMRQARLEVGKDGIDPHLMELLDELGVGAVVQKEWGNPEFVAVANLFHALYQRGDGMRAVDFTEYRPKLQEKLGKDVEQLIYLFPSAHKSALLADGILMAPIGEDIEVPNVLEGGMVTIPKDLRPYLVDMEVINSHDQHVLENSNPVHNLWSFYQHATVLPIMSEGARESIIEYQKRGAGATVADVLNWHESRFAESGKEVPELWQKHLELFRAPDGKFVCVEENMKRLADKDGDGEIDWDEFVSADFQQCFV
eukprot:scaffold2663_cov122-Skeletonema_menzelii.AAC.1